MSSPQTNVAYTFTNIQTGLALHLSDYDDKSIVSSEPLPTNPRQTWTLLRSDDGTFTIRSSLNDQSIGFEGALTDRVKLVTGGPSVAKDWVFQRQSEPNSFMISLVDSPFVIGVLIPAPGIPVQLLRKTGLPNQLWRIQSADF